MDRICVPSVWLMLILLFNNTFSFVWNEPLSSLFVYVKISGRVGLINIVSLQKPSHFFFFFEYGNKSSAWELAIRPYHLPWFIALNLFYFRLRFSSWIITFTKIVWDQKNQIEAFVMSLHFHQTTDIIYILAYENMHILFEGGGLLTRWLKMKFVHVYWIFGIEVFGFTIKRSRFSMKLQNIFHSQLILRSNT